MVIEAARPHGGARINMRNKRHQTNSRTNTMHRVEDNKSLLKPSNDIMSLFVLNAVLFLFPIPISPS